MYVRVPDYEPPRAVQGLELTPDDAAAHFQMARLLANNGNVEKSVAHLRVAAEIDGRYMSNLKSMLEVLEKRGMATSQKEL